VAGADRQDLLAFGLRTGKVIDHKWNYDTFIHETGRCVLKVLIDMAERVWGRATCRLP